MNVCERPNSIKEFIDYCSNCIICGKKLNIYFSYNSFYDYSFTNRNKVSIKDNNLIDSQKNIILNIDTNIMNENFLKNNFKKVSSGSGFYQYVDILKSCKTCIYENNCSFMIQSNNLKIDNVTLGIERVSFFIKNHKQIEVINYYEGDDLISKIYQLGNYSEIGHSNFLKVKNLLNFSNIRKFSQLKKRISNIIAFC
jgi:hypothetical protein